MLRRAAAAADAVARGSGGSCAQPQQRRRQRPLLGDEQRRARQVPGRPIRCYCAAAAGGAAGEGEAAQGAGAERRPSGAVVRKSGGGSDSPAAAAPPEESRPLWFTKTTHGQPGNPLAVYEAAPGADKGYPFASADARELPDTRELKDMSWFNRHNAHVLVDNPHQRVPAEILEKQRRLRLENKSKATLSVLLGEAEGDITLKRFDHVILVGILPARGVLTGGMLKQLEELIRQLFVMREVCGVVFQIRGDCGGLPDINAHPATKDRVQQAAGIAQRVANELLQLHMVTVCAFDGRLSGVAAELFTGCDFRFTSPRGTLRFDGAAAGWAGFLGGTLRLAQRVGSRSALLAATGGRSIGSDEAVQLGLVDRVADIPHDSAVKFLSKGFARESWEAIKCAKELVCSLDQMHMRQTLIREQFNFRQSWLCPAHREALEHYKRAM